MANLAAVLPTPEADKQVGNFRNTNGSAPTLGAELAKILSENQTFCLGDDKVCLDTATRTATADGKPLELPPIGFNTLAYIASRRNRVSTRQQICEVIWGQYNKNTRDLLRQTTKVIRDGLGRDDLGHPKTGAIIKKHGVGVMALSELGVQWVEHPLEPVLMLGEGRLEINSPVWLARLDGQILDLTPIEFKLLQVFALNPDKPLNEPKISMAVWGYTDGWSSSMLRTHIKGLRKKLGPLKKVINTHIDVGYKGLSGSLEQ